MTTVPSLSALAALTAENVRLRARLAQLTPWAITGLTSSGTDPHLLAELQHPTAPVTHTADVVPVLISELSEDAYAAGWLVDCEYELWARVEQYRRTGRCSPWGAATWERTTTAIAALTHAATSTGTWGVWSHHRSRTVSLDEWLTTYWPTAPRHCRELADATPTCGTLLNADADVDTWPRCHAEAAHDGPHQPAG